MIFSLQDASLSKKSVWKLNVKYARAKAIFNETYWKSILLKMKIFYSILFICSA